MNSSETNNNSNSGTNEPMSMEKINEFRKLPVYKQKSQAWFEQRRRYITASNVHDFLNNGSEPLDLSDEANQFNPMNNEVIRCLVYEKITGKNTFMGNKATRFGELFEPVAREIYMFLTPEYVEEFGLITSEKIPGCAVSPDGVTATNRLLEIKCPYSRKIKPNHVISKYWDQIQLQLAVCDCETCDFFECVFKEIDKSMFDELKVNMKTAQFTCICQIYTDTITLFIAGKPSCAGNISTYDHYRMSCYRRMIAIPIENDFGYAGHFFSLDTFSLQEVHPDNKWRTRAIPCIQRMSNIIHDYLTDSDKYNTLLNEFEKVECDFAENDN